MFVARRVFDKWGNCISSGLSLAHKRDIGYYYSTSQSIALQGRGQDDMQVSHKRPLPFQQTLFIFGLIYVYYLLTYY